MLIIPTASAVNLNKTDDVSTANSWSNLDLSADIVDLINQVNESLVYYYLKGLVDIGSRYTGSDNCKKAAQYIYDEFKKIGLDVYFDEWKYIRFQGKNVVATLKGTDPSSDAVFIICAHYDTITYPLYIPKKNCTNVGADNDGSGIAAILAIASILCKYHFNHTIRFIATSGEEVGAYGSYTYAKRAYGRNENIIAVLDVDMIGYANTTEGGRILKIIESERTEWISSFSNDVCQRYTEYIDLTVKPVPHISQDQQGFLDFGYDAVMYTESDNYPFLMTRDSIDKINFTYFVKATKFLLAIAAELANKPIDVQVRIVTPCAGCFYLFDHKIFRLPGFNLWRTDLNGMTYIIGRNNKIRVNISTDEEIKDVYFCIDSEQIMVDHKMPPYECKIERFFKPAIGKHTISVQVTTASGKSAWAGS